MKQVHVYAVIAALALAIIGCGGSGNDSGTTGTATGTVLTDVPVIEAVLAQDGVVPSDPSTFKPQDTLNIQVEQQLAFQLVSYSKTGARTVIPVAGWESSDTGSVYGSLADNSGLFVAGTRATTKTQYVGVKYNDEKFFTPYEIKPRQATIEAQVVNEATGAVVKDAALVFYDADGVVTGKVKQPYRDVLRASIPLNSVTFTVSSDSLPNYPGQPLAYQRYFRFGGKTYATGDTFCRAPLPVLSTGKNDLGLASVKLIPASAAAASADGCG